MRISGRGVLSTVCVLFALAAEGPAAGQDDEPFEEASSATEAIFDTSLGRLDWSDEKDFESAERGLIARYPDDVIRDDTGRAVWRFDDYEAMRDAPPPETVHPVLWRQARLNAASGLFRVTDRVYQTRGFDLANMTIIEGDTGLIIVDPLLSVEVSRAGLEHYYAHRPRRPVVAVIYTHSHMDHFGGVKGVISLEDVRNGDVAVYAPAGFLREAVSENVTAGNAMLRRTVYYSGRLLHKGPGGSIGAGLGPAVSTGAQSFIAPTTEIQEPGETRVIDGVEFVFQLANDTEAPAEMMFYLPQFKVLDVAEVAVHTVHNVLTPRGAQVRDTDRWQRTIDRALSDFGGEAEVMIGQHHWPEWGSAAITAHLESQRDFYKLVHDRALHLANQGYTMAEIGDALTLPEGLASAWTLQDYYGTLGSAGKAVFQRYIGWYDGNPANLNPLPTAASASRYVEYMGGADAILERARRDYDAGDYRWVTEVLNRLLFAEPGNAEARALQADALTQLGYQQVSATWRNVYLSAALELRRGVPPIPPGTRADDFVREMSPEMLFDYAAIALSPTRAEGEALSLNVRVTDSDALFSAAIENGILRYAAGGAPDPDAEVSLDKASLEALVSRQVELNDAIDAGSVHVDGDAASAARFFALLDRFSPDFDLATP